MIESQQNAGPPAHVEPTDLWTRLTTMPRPHTEVAFPRKDPTTGEMMTDKVVIWILTESELMASRASADAYARELLINPQKSGDANIGYQQIYNNAVVIECVFRCCRSTLNVKLSAFPSTVMMRKYLTSDELAVLFRAYCTFQAESGPMLSSMTKEEMDAWIAVLKEGGSRLPLSRLPLESVTELLMHSVSFLPKSQTDSGSSGSPPSESSPNTDPSSESNLPESLASLRRAGSYSLLDPAERAEAPVRDE